MVPPCGTCGALLFVDEGESYVELLHWLGDVAIHVELSHWW